MQLALLALILTAPYPMLTLLGRWRPALATPPAVRARVGVSLFFAFTGVGHFLQTDAMAAMLPPAVPYRTELIYVTGVLELLGAAGIWLPRLSRPTGLCLIAMLIGMLPSNVYAAFAHVPFGGHEAGPAYLLVRVPFQALVIYWVYLATLRPTGAVARTRPPERAAVGGTN
jgi:uncharacterized membrane protein